MIFSSFQLLNAQQSNARISPPLAGAFSNGVTEFVVGKIYVTPPVNLPRNANSEAEEETLDNVSATEDDLLLLYPNPVENSLYFASKTGKEPNTVTIFEQSGKVAFSGKVTNNTVYIGMLNKGTYLVQTNLNPVKQYTIIKK